MIEVKFVATGRRGFSRERIAYRQFSDGIADMNPNAQILGAKDEEEESEIRMTIRALIAQRLKTPHGKAFAYGEKFDEAEQALTLVLTRGFTDKDGKHQKGFLEDGLHRYQDDICEWLRANELFAELSDETVKRRLRSIRSKGGLETDGNGNYWSMKREIVV